MNESTDKLFNILNEIINKEGYLTIRITNLSNELLETLKIIENCISCKDKIKIYFNKFHESMNEIDEILSGLAGEGQEKVKDSIIRGLNEKLIYIDFELNKKVLCE